jgi:hypothetical protein
LRQFGSIQAYVGGRLQMTLVFVDRVVDQRLFEVSLIYSDGTSQIDFDIDGQIAWNFDNFCAGTFYKKKNLVLASNPNSKLR